MSIEIFDDDIEQLRDDLSVEPWNVISNDDVRNSCLLPIRISYEFVDMGDTEYGFNQNFSEKDTRLQSHTDHSAAIGTMLSLQSVPRYCFYLCHPFLL